MRRDGEWLTSAELEKQQVPHLGYGSQTPPPPDRCKTWHRRRSFPRPARTGRGGERRRRMRQRNQRSSSFTSSTLEPIYYLALSSELIFKFKAQISTLVKLVRKLPVFLWFAAIFPRCAPYLVCGKLLRGPQGPDNEVDISHQLIVKHQGVPKNRAGFTSKPQLLYNIKSSHTAFA